MTKNTTNAAANTKATGGKGRNKDVIKSADAVALVAQNQTATAAPVIQKQPEQPVIETSNKPAEVIQGSAPAAPAAVIQLAPAAPSKASKANAIFAQMFAMEQVPARKEMIAAAVQQAGLTPQGAATYLQNYKSKHGLTQPRGQAATV